MSERKQYYKFKGSKKFAANTVFERNSGEFSPIMGKWDEESFKKRSDGQGFDSIMPLNTTFEEVMDANKTWRQNGVITPENSRFSVHGTPTGEQYNRIADVMSRINAQKQYKFNYTKDFSKTLDGTPIDLEGGLDDNYRRVRDEKKLSHGGYSLYRDGYNEIALQPDIPEDEDARVLYHEIGHSLSQGNKVPDGLFKTNRTQGGQLMNDFSDGGENTINESEIIADHFADYIEIEEIYRMRYPAEARYFDKLLNKEHGEQGR